MITNIKGWAESLCLDSTWGNIPRCLPFRYVSVYHIDSCWFNIIHSPKDPIDAVLKLAWSLHLPSSWAWGDPAWSRFIYSKESQRSYGVRTHMKCLWWDGAKGKFQIPASNGRNIGKLLQFAFSSSKNKNQKLKVNKHPQTQTKNGWEWLRRAASILQLMGERAEQAKVLRGYWKGSGKLDLPWWLFQHRAKCCSKPE